MMNKINSLIIEDEQHDADLLLHLLSEYRQINVLKISNRIETAILDIEKLQPELIFLDIKLYGKLSFEILDKIDELNLNPKIVFTTAYDNYMQTAFKYAAFDYLLKPIDRAELKNTILRYQKNKEKNNFKHSLHNLKDAENKLIFNTVEGFELVNPDDILYLSTVKNQHYTNIHLIDDTVVVVSKSIGEIAPLLPDNFFKIHRSFVINIHRLIRVNRLREKCYLKGTNKEYSIRISREKIKMLKSYLANR